MGCIGCLAGWNRVPGQDTMKPFSGQGQHAADSVAIKNLDRLRENGYNTDWGMHEACDPL